MDDKFLKLLQDHQVIILPDEIEHDSYEMVLESCLRFPDLRLKLYCRGDGGDTRTGLAIVDIIRQHGRVVGILPSEANSTHALIFAGCPERYIYPLGRIGVHMVAWGNKGHVDSRAAKLTYDEFSQTDRLNAQILAEACLPQWNLEFWLNIINGTGSHGVTQFNSEFLIQCGMAKPIQALAGL